MSRASTQHRPRSVPPWLELLVFVLVFVAALSGSSCTCANQEYSRAYRQTVEQELDDYVHQGELEPLRAQIDAYFVDTGYVPVSGGTLGAETEWRIVTPEQREKLVATITPASGGFSVTLSRVVEVLSPQRWEGVGLGRRPDLELALAKTVDPEGASELGVDTVAGRRYSTPPAELWEKLEQLTLEKGFMMEGFEAPVDAVGTSVWVEGADEGEGGEQRSRLEVRFVRQGKDQLGVEIGERREKAVGERVWTPSEDLRDLDLELGLVRHRDPTQAGKVEQRADQAGRDAYDDAIARGAPPGCACAP